jgi:hypothetical protein
MKVKTHVLLKWMARQSLCSSKVALAAWACAAALGSLAAQAQAPTQRQLDVIYLLPAHGPDATAGARVGVVADEAASTAHTGTVRPLLRDNSAWSRAALVEMPADQIPGRYTRPKYALGFRSSAMKNLAKGMGLDADTCLAPLIRARLSVSPDGDAGGRVMVFARCSFH